ncbi:hypothetical protein RN001_012807 [Aquatica leii]|uniref:Uncharacterized protein n=1 Tax=Aquatica leii TaxID=1421715 RepID=A0AAN7NYW8_9COLE|nr:hypothetical protein RN001_012807 [Aquatica leii]
MAYVTDRPLNENEQENATTSVDKENGTISCTSNDSQFCQINLPSTSTSDCSEQVLTPEHIMPYPKTSPRKFKQCRKREKNRILTDTREKEEIEELHNNKKSKQELQKIEQFKKRSIYILVILFSITITEKKDTFTEDSDNSSESMPDLRDSSGDEHLNFDQEDGFDFDINNITVGDFVLCKFLGKKLRC